MQVSIDYVSWKDTLGIASSHIIHILGWRSNWPIGHQSPACLLLEQRLVDEDHLLSRYVMHLSLPSNSKSLALGMPNPLPLLISKLIPFQELRDCTLVDPDVPFLLQKYHH